MFDSSLAADLRKNPFLKFSTNFSSVARVSRIALSLSAPRAYTVVLFSLWRRHGGAACAHQCVRQNRNCGICQAPGGSEDRNSCFVEHTEERTLHPHVSSTMRKGQQ